MISLPRTCEKCGNSMYHYGSCEKCPQPPSTDAAKDARIAELERRLSGRPRELTKEEAEESVRRERESLAEMVRTDELSAARARIAELEKHNLTMASFWGAKVQGLEAQLAQVIS